MCSGCSLERLKFTGADLDYYLWALRTIFSGSSEIRTVFGIEAFLSLLFEVFFFFFFKSPAWADSVMENGSFFVQVFYVHK